MKWKILSGVVACVVCSVSTAATINLGASLNGSQEVPPVNTAAFGLATVAFDDVANTVDVKLLVEGITLSQLAAAPGRLHIHGPAAMGENGPVIVDLGSTAEFQQFGRLIEFFAEDVPIPDAASNGPLLLNAQTYLNLHTLANPGGEIRGQILNIPEPLPLVLMMLGVLSFAVRRRNGGNLAVRVS